MGKGDSYERKLRRQVNNMDGCGAMRMPASGSATPFKMPDLLLTDGSWIYAVELKYNSGKYCRFSKKEAKALIDFCNIWPALPCFVSRFSQDTSYYARHFSSKEEVEEINDNKSFATSRDERQEYPRMKAVLTGEAAL